MKILITGGLGFIGSNLARRLVAEGHLVVLVDSLIPQYGGNFFNIHGLEDSLVVNISDLRDPYSIRALLKDVDIVFNLAGQTSHADSMIDPIADLDINSKSQLSLLQAVRDVVPDAVVVFASTRQIYGRPKYLPVDEHHPIRPVDVNGVNKVAGEQFHLLYHDVYGLKTTALRLTNTYGPCMRIKDARQTFLGIWIKNLLTGEPIHVFGDGSQLRDFNYVDDVVDALVKASTNPACYGRAFNLGSREVINLADLAILLSSMREGSSWKKVVFPPDRKAIDIGDYYGDFTLAYDLIGWSPSTALSVGLKKTIAYYAHHLDFYI
jgi:UDP-glucose 4-epimerase